MMLNQMRKVQIQENEHLFFVSDGDMFHASLQNHLMRFRKSAKVPASRCQRQTEYDAEIRKI